MSQHAYFAQRDNIHIIPHHPLTLLQASCVNSNFHERRQSIEYQSKINPTGSQMENKSYECVQKEEQIVLEHQDNFGQDGMRRLALNSGKYDVRCLNCWPLTPCHLRP